MQIENMNREIFRAIDGFLNYEISSHGRVRNANTGQILKQHPDKDGYKKILLSKPENTKKNPAYKHFIVHRLIADAFLENPENLPLVDHKDGNKTNNAISNLRWATFSQNGQNRKKKNDVSSQYIGVHLNGKSLKYHAVIGMNGKKVYLGSFVNEVDGARAYDLKAREVFGENAKTNF
jgi:hypothetical protein